MADSNGGQFDELRTSVELAAAAARLADPVQYRALLQLIVETAASVLDAETGSLFLVDEESGELAFEVALGLSDEDIAQIRLEPGTGIAGMVAGTGQPVAITNLEEDPRHAGDIARKLGRQPHSLLAVPLFIEDEVVGVLELLDKRGGGSFSQGDMSTIALFANQAALAIVQSRAQQQLHELLHRLASPADSDGQGVEAPEARIARLVYEIAGKGDAELQLCEDVLLALADYMQRHGA